MKSTACLIRRVIKFTTRMKCRKYQTFCGHSFFMHIYRDSTSVIRYCTGAVFFQYHVNLAAISRQMFIHCIIHDLIDQMIQSFSGYTSDIHTRSFTNRFQSFQNRYTPSIVCFLFCHGYYPFLYRSIFKHLFYIIHDFP